MTKNGLICCSLFSFADVQKSMETHENDSSGNNICEELQGVLKSKLY